MKLKLLIWISVIISLIPIAIAQTGLFGDSGTSFLSVGVIIIITFLIVDQLRKNIKNK